MPFTNKFLIICVIFLFLITKPVNSQYHLASEFCSDEIGNYTANSTYQNNLYRLLSSLTNQASLSLFNNATVGHGVDQTYGLFMCRGDLTVQQCQVCVNEASSTLRERCPVQKQAIVWFYECLVRYSNHSIFSLYEEQSPRVFRSSNINFSDPERFDQIFEPTINSVIMQAAYDTRSRGFAAAEANVTSLETLYVAVQCTPDILGSGCERCLRVALRDAGGSFGTTRDLVDMFMTSCWLRYSQAPIIGDIGNTSPESPSSTPFPQPVLPPGRSTASPITTSYIALMLEIMIIVIL